MKVRKIHWLGGALLAMSSVSGSAYALSPEVSLSAQAGYRVDAIDWQVSGSEIWQLDWSDMDVYHTRLGLDVKMDRIHVRGMFGYGVIASGLNQEYATSRTNNTYNDYYADTEGDVLDSDIAIGYRFHVRTVEHRHTYIMPTIGYSYHEQNLEDTNGVDWSAGTIPNLQRTYDIEWEGYWLGLNLWETDESQDFTIAVELAYYDSDFYAVGNLNHESAYASPVSFEHGISTTTGIRFSMYGNYALSEKTDLVFGFDYQTWEATDGTHRNYLANSTTTDLTLDAVNWESTSMNVGLAYFFN